MAFYPDDFHLYRDYQRPRYKYIMSGSFDSSYHKWFQLLYNIMNEPAYDPLSRYGGLAEAKRLFNKNVTPIKNLVKKMCDPSRLTLDQRNYFLYDISNIIDRTFYTDLNRKVQTYGMITTAPAGIKSTHMVTPKKVSSSTFKKKSTERMLSLS